MIMSSNAVATGAKSLDKKFRRDAKRKELAQRENDCEIRITHSREEFSAAFRLVYKEYLRQGLITRSNRYNLRILPHQLLRTSWVFTAIQDKEVVATLSLVEDGELGLPMEELYDSEIDHLRQEGKQLAELTCLAHRPHTNETMWNRGKVTSTLGILIGHVLNFAMHRKMDTLVISVHPRHASFYRRRYGFVDLGPDRSCPWAGNHPAKALQLDREGLCTDVMRARGTLLDKFLYYQTTKIGPISSAVSQYYWDLLEEVCPAVFQENRDKTA